jgi:dynein heavy chain
MKNGIRDNQAYVDVLNKFNNPLNWTDFQVWYTVKGFPKRLHEAIKQCHENIKADNYRFETDLVKEQEELKQQLALHAAEVKQFIKYGPCEAQQVEERAAQVDSLNDKIKQALDTVDSFKAREVLFGIPSNDYSEVEVVQGDFEPFAQLWQTAFTFQTLNQGWMTNPFMELDGNKMQQSVAQMFATVKRLDKVFADRYREPAKVCSKLTDTIVEFRKCIPIVQMLRNPGLRPRHWNEISTRLGTVVEPGNLTLTQLLGYNAVEHAMDIEEVTTSAEKEFQLDTQMDAMMEEWKPMVFEVLAWKSTRTYVIRKTDLISILLDEQIVKTQTMRGSPYIRPIEAKAKKWEARLVDMQSILEEWLNCQKTWMYLEPIFASDDIIRQMPTETRRFQGVDRYARLLG